MSNGYNKTKTKGDGPHRQNRRSLLLLLAVVANKMCAGNDNSNNSSNNNKQLTSTKPKADTQSLQCLPVRASVLQHTHTHIHTECHATWGRGNKLPFATATAKATES